MTLNEFYTTVGGNYEDVIARLHSEAFTEKFLRMIPQDNSLPLLKEAAAAGDVSTAFRAVHTLKGIALNLGLTGLAAACGTMTTLVRSVTLPLCLSAAVTTILSQFRINIANMSMWRHKRGGDALMIIETDQHIKPEQVTFIGQLPGILSITYYDKEEDDDVSGFDEGNL